MIIPFALSLSKGDQLWFDKLTTNVFATVSFATTY
jgi:hypothetical protein